MKYASALVLAVALATPAMADDLWVNSSDTDGLNGLSNATEVPFGFRRMLLDDFTIPTGDSWDINGIRWLHIWNALPPGSGTGLEIQFRSDSGGTPGTILTSLLSSNTYSEVGTGRSWFGRQEAASEASFDTVTLGEGTYWIEATIVGTDNNFWMTAPVLGSAVWVNYADFGGLMPGINVFGVNYDIHFVLTGSSGGGFNLSLSGNCPGAVTASTTGATAGGTVAYIFGLNTGSTTIPSGPCAGTQLGIQGSVQLVGTDTADGSGNSSLSGNAPNAACGRFLQALDVSTCSTSNVAQIN